MLAQDHKTSHPGKRSRRKIAEEPLPDTLADVAPDAVSDAVSDAGPDVAYDSELLERVSASTSRRAVVTARPISRADRALVSQADWMTNVLPVLGEDSTDLAVIEPISPPALLDDEPERPLILVGDATSSMVAMRLTPPKRKKRHWLSGAIILTLITVVALTGVATVTPLATGHAEGVAVHASGPLGLPVALDATNKPPSGQWVALVGLQPNQDVGGGAGPGVQAPGSAGLPVSSVKVVVNTAPPQSIGAVSPPPLSPWPPTYAYAAVPGYSAFGMSDVNGYYSWAFGQCTWWAQYERQNENLMHMGNAQYWASGAASRGYKVGSLPAAGSTVVFQPGVQGAGGAGHVAHVVKVYPNGWFLISEMNFYWNGGGWGRVDYRFAHSGWGVQFIY